MYEIFFVAKTFFETIFSAHGGERRSRKRYMSRVRVITVWIRRNAYHIQKRTEVRRAC